MGMEFFLPLTPPTKLAGVKIGLFEPTRAQSGRAASATCPTGAARSCGGLVFYGTPTIAIISIQVKEEALSTYYPTRIS